MDTAIWNRLNRFGHRLGSPPWLYRISRAWMRAFGWIGVALLCVGTVWALAYAPVDFRQGNSYRIMFVHVPTVFAAQSVYVSVGVCALLVLVWRVKMADMLMASAVGVGAVLTALGLFTGSIWAKPTWGTWWVNDGRTLSTLLLLFLYFGLFALREALPRQELATRACAILALVGVINLPVIKYSVDWWTTLHQGASLSVTRGASMPSSMWLPLVLNILGVYCLTAAAVLKRLRIEVLRREAATRWVRETVLEHA